MPSTSGIVIIRLKWFLSDQVFVRRGRNVCNYGRWTFLVAFGGSNEFLLDARSALSVSFPPPRLAKIPSHLFYIWSMAMVANLATRSANCWRSDMFVYSARNLRPPISRKSEEIGRGSAKCALLPAWARFLCVSCPGLNKGGRSLALDVAMICSNTWYSKLVLRGVTNAAGNYVVSKWHHLRHGSTRRGLHHRSSVSLPFMCREILNREFIAAPGSIKTHGPRSAITVFFIPSSRMCGRNPSVILGAPWLTQESGKLPRRGSRRRMHRRNLHQLTGAIYRGGRRSAISWWERRGSTAYGPYFDYPPTPGQIREPRHT
jgi:hypothetical protein